MLSAFTVASNVVPPRSPKPVLQNIKFEAGESGGVLTATDLEIAVRATVDGLQIDAPGQAVLPISQFSSLLRESSDATLRLESDGSMIFVKGEHSQFRFPAHDPDEFPLVAPFEESKYHEISAALLRELIRRTVFATDTESTRYALGGVLLELEPKRAVAVGTDGRRLAKMEGPAESVNDHATGASSTIVPTKAMHFIERVLTDADGNVQVAARPTDLLVRTPRFTIYSRLVEGRYPKWRDVFPSREGYTSVDLLVGPLAAALRQAQIATDNDSRGVDFTFGDGLLQLAGRAANVGESHIELPVPYDGKTTTITLDPKYVLEYLKVLSPDVNFRLEMLKPDSAAVCSTEDGYGYVIMPLSR